MAEFPFDWTFVDDVVRVVEEALNVSGMPEVVRWQKPGGIDTLSVPGASATVELVGCNSWLVTLTRGQKVRLWNGARRDKAFAKKVGNVIATFLRP